MEEQFQVTKTAEQPGLSFKELLFKYLRFLPLFIISVALSLLVAYIYLRYTTPIYQSTGALIVKDDNGVGGGASDRFQQMFVLDNSMNIRNEIEILRSRPLMKRVVENLNLNLTYYVKGKIKESNVYTASPFKLEVLEIADSLGGVEFKIEVENSRSFRLNEGEELYSFGQVIENTSGKFRFVHNPVAALSNEYRVTWEPTENRVSSILQRLVVAPGGSNGVIQLSFEATNPQEAADVISNLMKEYQVATREDKNETNRRMLDFIDGRLDGVEQELDSVTNVLLTFQRDNNIINTETQSGTYFARIEKTDEEINGQRVQMNIAQMVENYVADRQNAYNLVPSTLGLADGTLSTLISTYNVAQLERKSLIDANNPVTGLKVKQKEDEIERLRINILESLNNLQNSITAAIERLQTTSATAQSRLQSMPLKERRMMEIKTQQLTKQTVYNLLLEKREQTAISLAGTISNMKVIEEAVPKPIPIKPSRKSVYLICFVIGLALPAVFVFGMELLNDKITNRYDVEKLTSVPIVGEVGHSYLNDETLVVKPNHRGIVAEQFRIIRSNLQYVLTNTTNPVIMVTSSFSGEGKSFVSSNLAAVMSLANKKTIVLEFDIRKPKILAHLGMPKKPGITNYLVGTVKLEDLPIAIPGYEKLFVLPCGPIPPNPSELLLDPKLDELFKYLKENFECIVVDTAPIGMVSDAMALSRFANATLYIVRQGHTYKKQVSLIQSLYEENKLPKVSLILNDVKMQTGYGYYGYGRYGYGYGYGSKSGYFSDEGKPPGFWAKWFKWIDMGRWDKKKTKV